MRMEDDFQPLTFGANSSLSREAKDRRLQPKKDRRTDGALNI